MTKKGRWETVLLCHVGEMNSNIVDNIFNQINQVKDENNLMKESVGALQQDILELKQV